MSSLFASLKEKAQSASNQLAGSFNRPESPQGSQAGGLAGLTKSHAFESLHHQLRTFQQQYSSSTTPVQKIITTTKGIAIDFDNVSRDSQTHSKELYFWGQAENDDIKDVTDRLAWLSYVQGTLTGQLASKVNTSRTAFKHLRDAENALAPRRNIRIGLENQISRIEYDQRKDQQAKLQELKAQLRLNEEEDSVAEKDIEVLKRKAIRETEQEKWEAIREYAEKLSMVAQAALSVVPALPPIPPTKVSPYQGGQTTAAVRASLQKALDGYTPGNINLIVAAPANADLKHTRSFGVTHAQELSHIDDTEEPSVTGNIPITPPPTTATAPPPQPPRPSQQPQLSPTVSPTFPHPSITPLAPSKPASIAVPGTVQSPPLGTNPSQSPPLNPANLNQAPALIPVSSSASSATSPVVAPDPADPSIKIPSVTPTVAETGVPKVAGPEGPGPANGSLLNKNAPESPKTNPFSSPVSPLPPTATVSKFESAEDEKKRLAREEREKILHGEGGSTSTAPHSESAEEEKKRLEREGASDANPPGKKDDTDDLPPYQEF
ncbi:Eisosome component PIL1-domain-containing protein [Irpex rosettiformis]|uniref:Eisosome component PIL1-domain-containing protein n=1 Tax=Irpex rosettiformis TaxID=378272 RepID=A0ACB8UKA4_9APHY|nr:Eisosome component PIL1-domain-containing protein [Irpex rosettiformis]